MSLLNGLVCKTGEKSGQAVLNLLGVEGFAIAKGRAKAILLIPARMSCKGLKMSLRGKTSFKRD